MQQDETGEHYASTLTRFAAAAIRSASRGAGRLRLPLPESTKSKTNELIEALKVLPRPKPSSATDSETKATLEEKKAVLKLQEFFFSAVVDSVAESQKNRFKCPVLTYTACFAYNEDDTWKLAPQVTSMLAQWSFLLRATALSYAIRESKDQGRPAPE